MAIIEIASILAAASAGMSFVGGSMLVVYRFRDALGIDFGGDS